MNHRYDYVIAGAGAAGLSLATRLARSQRLHDKSILIIDRDEKKTNDRTWCFWETGTGPYESLVYHQWKKAWVYGPIKQRLMDLGPYSYKLIRGIDFYNKNLEELGAHPRCRFLHGEISETEETGDGVSCRVNGEMITGRYFFNSLFTPPVLRKKDHYLLQHFRGWRIRVAEPVFDPGVAILMDFRVSQAAGTTFVYVLPFSREEALVEYTLFSKKLLEPVEYEEGLRHYLDRFYPGAQYEILEMEQGVIPMTDYDFRQSSGRMIQIGTAGGQTKASTGYTFSFIQKHSDAIVAALEKGEDNLVLPRKKKRFRFYDRTLLEVLEKNYLPGSVVFETLFMKNEPARILRFLDEESGLGEEISILGSLPWAPFMRAAFF